MIRINENSHTMAPKHHQPPGAVDGVEITYQKYFEKYHQINCYETHKDLKEITGFYQII